MSRWDDYKRAMGSTTATGGASYYGASDSFDAYQRYRSEMLGREFEESEKERKKREAELAKLQQRKNDLEYEQREAEGIAKWGDDALGENKPQLVPQAVQYAPQSVIQNPADPTNKFSPEDARAKAENRIRAEQAYKNWDAELQKADPNYDKLSTEDKYKMFADEIRNQQIDASRSQGMREWASKLQGDPDFDRMSEDEKRRQYLRNLDRIAEENGTLPEDQRAELSEYKYNGLTDKQKAAIDSIMESERKRYENYDKYERSGSQGILHGFLTGGYNTDWEEQEKAAREDLRRLGWDEQTIDREVARYKELEDYRMTKAKNEEMAIDPNASAGEKAFLSSYNTLYGIGNAPTRGLESAFGSLMEGEGAYGKNTSSMYNLSSKRSEEGYRQVKENAIGNENPKWQTAYDIGVSTAESAYTMAWMQGIGALAGVGGAGTALAKAAKTGQTVTKGMKAAAAAEKAIELGTLIPFSLNAYESGYRDAVNRGFSEKQAQGYGAAVGGIEALTEVISLDKAWKLAEGTKVGRNLFMNALVQAGIEGSEEVASELGDRFADYVAVNVGNTGKTQKELDIEGFMSQGMSEEEAKQKAAEKFIDDLKMAGLSGAVSGGISAGVWTGVGAFRSKYGNEINQAISDRYNSLELEGNSAYEQKLKEDKERYANNPTQFVVDNYKAVTDEEQKIKKGLQDIADKEREGKKLSISDKTFIANNAQVDQAFINNLYDISDESDVPYEYRSVRTEVTEDEARKRLAEAAANGDAAAFTDAINLIQNAKDDDLRNNATKIIDEYSGMAQSHGITPEAIGQAQKTRAQAYREGLEGKQAQYENPDMQIAYNEGMKAGIEARAKTIVSSKEAMDNASVGKKDGSMVKLTGQFDQNGIVTSDGESVKLENLDVSSESAMLKAYEFADNYKNVNTKNEFLRGIKDNTNIKEYNRDFQKAYDFGMSGVSEETMKQGYSTLDDDQMRIAYEAGQREARIRATNELNKSWGVEHKAEGVTYNEAEITDKKALELADSIAAKLGADLHITSSLDRSNARGAYKQSENAIYVRADRLIAVSHEIGEFTETFNKSGYDELKKVIAEVSAKKFGADRYHRMLQQYKDLYGAAGQDNSADEMTGEMFNDSIAAMFSTEESAQLLADYLAGNYDPQQAKSLGQKAAGVAKKLANSIKKLVSSENLSGNETDYTKAVYEIADDLSKHAADFLKVLDTAIKNSQQAQGKTTNIQTETQNFSLEKDANGNTYVDIQDDIISGIRGKKQIKEYVREYLKEYFPTIDLNGFELPVIRDSRSEFTDSKYTRQLQSATNNLFIDKMRMAANLDEIVQGASDYTWESNKHPRKDDGIGFVRGNIQIRVGNNDYIADVVLQNRQKAGLVFYDLVDINPTKIKATKTSPMANNSSAKSPAASNQNISQNAGNSNTVYSLEADSDGNNLTEGQQEYFKESEIRDDQGRLKVMYHGTQNDFTVFDVFKEGGKNGTAEGYGIYLTDNPEVSAAYGNNQLKGYANVTKPAYDDQKNITVKDLTKLVKATCEAEAKKLVEVYGDYDNVKEALSGTWVSNMTSNPEMLFKSMDSVYREVADKILEMNYDDMSIIQEIMADMAIRDYEEAYEFYDILKDTMGIDGFVTNWEDSKTGKLSQVVVAFDSNQFKDINNENPSKDPDIRYSLNMEEEILGKDSFKDGDTRRFSLETEPEHRGILAQYLSMYSGLSKKDQKAILDTLDWGYEEARKLANEKKFRSFGRWSKTGLVLSPDGTPMIQVMGNNGKPIQSVAVSNGEYPLNIDFTQVCKKRLALNEVLNRLVSDANLNIRMLTESDIAGINALIKEHQFEIACGLCFVDARRYRVGTWADSFVNGKTDDKTGEHTLGWNELVNSMLKKGVQASYFKLASDHVDPLGALLYQVDDKNINFKTIDKIIKPYLKEDGTIGQTIINGQKANPTEEVRMAYLLKTDPSSRYLLDKNDIIASKGLDALRVQDPKLYALVNAHGGTSKPKLSHGFTAYGGEVIRSLDWGSENNFSKESAYSVGGVRVQSFSDYVANMFFDYMQMFADMSARELPSHAYTKEVNYVKLFGMTGQRINMSLIFKGANITPEQQARLEKLSKKGRKAVLADPEFGELARHAGLDENGDYIYEDESFPPAEAYKLRKDPKYKNCGTIAVGLSDEHIKKLLADPQIDMVIPYHSSGVSQIIKNARNLVLYTDYTDSQNTRKANGKKIDGKDYDWYGNLASEINPNGMTLEETVADYLKWCDEHNYLPVFDQFRNEPGYWKLLIDFRSYDNKGKFMPQGKVSMTFPDNFTDIVKESLAEQQEFEDRLETEMSDEQNALYSDVKAFLKEKGAVVETEVAIEVGDEASNSTGAYLGNGADVHYSLEVTDEKTLDFLENQEHVTTYRTFQQIGDGLYAPMNAMDGKNLGYKSRIGVWEQATEDPTKAVQRGNGWAFPLKAGNATTSGKSRTTWAAYNPYLHSSNLVFNDQFTAAYDRPNLVVVECEVPVSEETSGYHADKAKDPVGWLDWKSGKVANALKKKGIERKVFLSRWMKPVRVLSNAEVADMYKESLDGTDIVVPWNVVSPPLREELEKRSVPIDYGYQSSVKASYDDKFSLDLGYHAGDLGKAESLWQSNGGRSTGHYGTGTYFVGDEALISGSTYGERPHHTVDFSNYNLYRPTTPAIGEELHNFLKDINSFYNLDDEDIRTEREWEVRKDDLEYNISEGTISKEDAVKEARLLFGNNDLQSAISHAANDKEYWWGSNNVIDPETNTEYTYEEFVQDWDDDKFDDMMYDLIYDHKYAPRYIGQLEHFDFNLGFNAKILFDISEGEARQIIRDIRQEIRDADYDYNDMRVADSASTRFMKALGYEGVDVRGLKGLDNTTFGSVIYDLKGEDLERKIANGARYSLEVDSEGTKLTEGQQRYFNNSKVVDDEGRLKVMYHGARGAGFTVFNPEYSDDKRSLFFTDDPRVAKSYTGTYEIFSPLKQMSFEELDSAIQGYTGGENYLELDGDDVIVREVGYGDEDEEAYRGSLQGAQEYFIETIKNLEHYSDANYKVYLNIQNPYVMDAKGANWDELNEDAAWDKHFGDVDITKTDEGYEVEWMSQDFEWHHDTFNSKEDLENTFGKLYELSDDYEIFINDIYLDKDGERIPTNTRMISQMAQEQGHDGVIIKNVYDIGIYASSDERVPSTIAIAFNPEQIKDVNNVNPTSSADIRYALDVEDEGGWVDSSFLLSDAPKNEAEAVKILEEGMEAMKNESVDIPKLRNLALKLRNEFGSSYNTNELTSNLEKAFAYMQTEDHVDYKTMMGILKDIARPVIEASGEKVGEQEYRNFINRLKGYKIKLTNTQKDEVKSALGSYGNFCRAVMPLTISDNGNVTLDQVWDEMVEASGYALDRDASEGDMPLVLLDTLTAMRPVMRNDFGGDVEDVARDLAMRIVEEYIGGNAAKKMQSEIKEIRNRLKKQYSERMKNAQGKANAEIRARNKKRAEQAKERDAVRKYRHDVKLNVKKLYKWITNPTEGKSVPHDLVTPIMQFLNAFDFVDPDIQQLEDGRWHTKVFQRMDYENGRKKFIYKDLYGATREDVLKQFNEAVGRGEGTKEQKYWAQSMQSMRKLYDQALSGDDFENPDMDFLQETLAAEDLAKPFDDLLEKYKDSVSMNHLNSTELSLVDNIVKNIFHAVNQRNKAYTINAEISNLAQETMKEAEGKTVKNRGKLGNSLYEFLRINNATPKTFFKLLGDASSKIYKSLRTGLNTEISDIKRASEFMESVAKEIDMKDINKWTGDKAVVHEIALTNGTIRMTDGQIMSLYCTVRRTGARDRMIGGIAPGTLNINGKEVDQEKIYLTDRDISKLESILTPQQINLAKKMQQYMAINCAKDGNATSRQMYGFDKFVDPTYYPYKVDKDSIPTTNATIDIPRYNGAERQGFTKQLKENASNTLVIEDIFDVFTDHVVGMAKYHGYAPCTKDALRWMNYRESYRQDGNAYSKENKKAIDALANSKQGVPYIQKLLLDINQTSKSAYIGNITDRLIGNYKAAAVGANARVVIQQPTAYFRASNMISPKYLLTVNPMTAIRNIKKSQEQCPISWWKSKGYYETNLGQPLKEIVTGAASVPQKIKDVMMSPAGWADDFTWGFLYTAVEKEQRAMLKGKGVSEAEFRQAVNDRFDDLVDSTQVVDSALHRSQYMRSKDMLNKLQTAFMAEPTKTFNMLMEAAVEDRKEGKTLKRTSRATAAFFITAIVNSAAQAIMDALRRTSDDDDLAEKFKQYMEENFKDNINPFNLLPIVKEIAPDVFSILEGDYSKAWGNKGSARFDVEAINSIVDAGSLIMDEFKKYVLGETINSNKTAYGKYMALIKPVSQVTGIPIYNLSRDAVALYNAFFDNLETTVSTGSTAKNELKKGFVKDVDRKKSEDILDEGIENAIEHGVSIYDLKGAVQSQYKNKYFDAYTDGDMETADELAERAARAYARMGLEDEAIDEIINAWKDEVVTYSQLDKNIASGENIEEEVKRVQEAKDDDKIIKHIMDRYTETIAYEDLHDTESQWRENVEKALQTIDPTLTFDSAHEDALQKAAEKAAKEAEQAHNAEMKNEFFDAVEKKDGSAGRKALQTMKDEGIESKTVKSAVSTRYHDIWKEAGSQAEKDKAKSDWKSAYTLVNNVYGSKSNDLDKTWSDWEKEQK